MAHTYRQLDVLIRRDQPSKMIMASRLEWPSGHKFQIMQHIVYAAVIRWHTSFLLVGHCHDTHGQYFGRRGCRRGDIAPKVSRREHFAEL